MSQLFPLVGGKILKEVRRQGKQLFVVVNSVIKFYTVFVWIFADTLECPYTAAVSYVSCLPAGKFTF